MKGTKPIYTKNNIQLFRGNCLEIMDELYEEKGKCILSGKPSLQRVVFAKSY